MNSLHNLYQLVSSCVLSCLVDLENERKKIKCLIYILTYVTILIVKCRYYFKFHPQIGPRLESAKTPGAVSTPEGGTRLR